MGRRAVQLSDVAERAGVSVAAASYALSGRGRVSQETRDRVLRVAEELGYRPNATARNLRRRRHGVLGLHLPHRLTSHEFYMDFVFGAVETCDDAGLSVLLVGEHGARDVGLDAAIVLDVTAADPIARHLLSGGAPVVAAEEVPPELARPAVTVTVDHTRHATEMLDALDARGHHRIALLAPGSDAAWAGALQTAYRRWCETHDRRPILTELPFFAQEQVQVLLGELMQARPDVVLVGTDSTAGSVATWLREHDHRETAVAAYIRSSATDALGAGVLALDLRPREFGRECARRALEMIGQEPPAEPVTVEFTGPRLVGAGAPEPGER
ncbi:LacI family DNA-binding transcriptional regulator [Pseudonocardia sp. NPDC049635]|uniref:LacI family DNA-binding transcriptional regulator n=1 Tax=Pseudonocardia sp. NPDC049635 TaxID=3155506 RepID=UPI0033CD0075